MDLTPILLGSLVGLVTGLVPGLHVNTLAAAALLLGPSPGMALGLVAVGVVHTFVSILPTTYLGAPGEDTALAALPAHRMLHAGRAPEAVRLSAHASLAAVTAVMLLVLPYKWLLGEPLRLAAALATWMPWILAGVLMLLVAREAPHARWAAIMVMAAAGALGWLTRTWPLDPWVPMPATALLPLLTGLFAAPTLLVAIRTAASLPTQVPPPRKMPRTTPIDVALGIGAAAVTAVLPGLTSAVATAVARAGRRDEDPRPVISTLSAVNTAHLTLSLVVLWLLGATRSGLADAVRPTLLASTWVAGPMPIALHHILFTVMAAGLLGAAGTRLVEPAYRAFVARVPARGLHAGVLAFLVLATWVFTGPWGLALFVVATAVGNLPLAFGVRRVHLAACLIVPVILREVV